MLVFGSIPFAVGGVEYKNICAAVSRRKNAMWSFSLVWLLLALGSSTGSVETPPDRVLLPIEVLGADGTVMSRTVTLSAAQSESTTSLWLQVHGVRYPDQASVQLTDSPWTPL